MIKLHKLAFVAFGTFLLAGCTSTGQIMDGGNGTYWITGYAAPLAGGAKGSTEVAFRDATAFCAQRGGRAVVVDMRDQDSYRGSFYQGSGGIDAAGRTTMHFRCDR